MKAEWKQYIEIINSVVKPALGCTEPISAAYAGSAVASMLGGAPDTLKVFVSDNLFKNSMGVFVPGTGKIGLPIAAASGAVGGDFEAGLEVLAKITPEDVEKAQAMIDAGNVEVSREKTNEFIYCRAEATLGDKSATITISGGHTLIVEKTLNGEVIFAADKADNAAASTASVCEGVDISIEKIYEFATQVDFADIEFILQARDLNMALSQEGLDSKYGLEIGRTMGSSIATGLMGSSLTTDVLMYTSAASDARMGGATLPAMSNYGSGNQGIAATVPVVKTAEFVKADDEKLARALIMSHLGAVYIKSHYPPLCAFCGNTATSSAASFAMVYLKGGSFEQSCFAIQNVLSDTAGMVCDGAKATCAMKVGSSSQAAMKGMMLALAGQEVALQGVIAGDVEKTIRNIGRMVSTGMAITDKEIIEIMAS
ncbi:L-serine ammonia-lyase, iron-sulfur-dependent, subunit alpha [Vibrio sp. SCSIO 43136]|uniref:L-cysteine desulfidase family protein n=1 Tax=Vibrio sp. SCSIO 43136 TaxID=2819101 RepID=UPI0020762C0C|nr:L-serine ammonia-lyase, iron-sulfur-dependent, subunit alpha [Vibrio sp. SCSIO 43136]USD67879.1 serine dehydratase subunit alpha family protein [Vibrio sp. SCSIO 43136]